MTPGDLDVLVLFVTPTSPGPSPTAERREAILGDLAEWLHDSAREARERLMQAQDTDDFVRLAGSLAKLARGVRQCVLMHDRLEGRRVAAEAEAEAHRADAAAQARAEAVERQKTRIDRAVSERFDEEWPDEGDHEANDVFNQHVARLNERLDDLAEARDFLATDPDALIAKLCHEFGIAPPAPTQSPLIPAKAGTQADSVTPQPLHGSPHARGRAGGGEGHTPGLNGHAPDSS